MRQTAPMERLSCPTCANEVFFDSMRCVRCSTELVYDLQPDGLLVAGDTRMSGACMIRDTWRCNWRPDPAAGPSALCPSCLIVDPGAHTANRLLIPFLTAQRRALWQLTELGIAWASDSALKFNYRSSSAGDSAVIGHLSGLITLDIDEADPAQR